MASIGIGIEDLILQVLVLTLGWSEVLVLVLVSEKWYCPCLICTQGDPNDLHPGRFERSTPGTIRMICTWDDPNNLHPS